mmetsp:Transcript_20309/g.22636  ORF Transcript_20309/g.22636 Transcript_20309/m.22636 type:complete len:149 (+) Transcript_20309:92-538(+)
MGILHVKVIKATHLKDKDGIGKSDPYVKLELEQDNVFKDKDYGFQKTSTIEGNVNPVSYLRRFNSQCQFVIVLSLSLYLFYSFLIVPYRTIVRFCSTDGIAPISFLLFYFPSYIISFFSTLFKYHPYNDDEHITNNNNNKILYNIGLE